MEFANLGPPLGYFLFGIYKPGHKGGMQSNFFGHLLKVSPTKNIAEKNAQLQRSSLRLYKNNYLFRWQRWSSYD